MGELDAGHRGRGGAVEGLSQHTVGRTRSPLLLVMGAVALVLVIACAAVSGLLARGSTRQREVALKLALGAMSSSAFKKQQ